MPKLQIEIDQDSFTAAIVNSPRSALGKKGIKGGVNVKIADIPSNVLTTLLFQAIQAHMQVGLKTLDPETATTETCQEAMKARLALLVSGTATGTTTRKAPTRDPIKAAAKAMVKKAIQERTDEKLDGKVLTKMVSELFKLHDTWVKGDRKDEKLAKTAQLVENALKSAREAHESQAAMNDTLAKLSARAAKASQEAKAAKEAAANAEAGEAEEAETKPTPTQKVKAEKGKTKPPAR